MLTKKLAHLEKMNRAPQKPGLLLASIGRDRRPNVMTIGWALIGILWEKPVIMVAVRLSRYTHKLIEYSKDSTVNVADRGMDDLVEFCGSTSGRVHKKFDGIGLKTRPAKKVESSIIEQCILHFECRVIYKIDVDPQALLPEIICRSYPKDDYHTFYFRSILATYQRKPRRVH